MELRRTFLSWMYVVQSIGLLSSSSSERRVNSYDVRGGKEQICTRSGYGSSRLVEFALDGAKAFLVPQLSNKVDAAICGRIAGMYLIAAVTALEALEGSCEGLLHTESKYLCDGITKWIANREKRGWLTSPSFVGGWWIRLRLMKKIAQAQ